MDLIITGRVVVAREFIVGGMNGNGGMMVKVEWMRTSLIYDLAREKWSKGPKLPQVFEFPHERRRRTYVT